MKKLPNFLIIGAMKCATSTLHEQLAIQPGIFMTDLKEPNFFSNDEEYARGLDWYQSLFDAANLNDYCGESSTHYTKLPTYPKTIERIRQHLSPDIKFIYVMRHPIDRLVSQYIHEWTQNVISVDINRAIDGYPELIAYSQYTMQLQAYFDAFGQERVLPVFFERLIQSPQAELERVCQFLGYGRTPEWSEQVGAQNISSERMRKSLVRDFLVYLPLISTVRSRIIPQQWRDWVKTWWQMRKKPELSPAVVDHLKLVFDQDLKILGDWFGTPLTCDTFKDTVRSQSLEWVSDIRTTREISALEI